MTATTFQNPYRPGAGHMPTYLAGREREKEEFRRLLRQTTIMENLVVIGHRGVGKTVLLETLKPIAIESKWLWVGTDLSESATLSESNIVTRMFADLAVVSSSLTFGTHDVPPFGFVAGTTVETTLNFQSLAAIYSQAHGLNSDKLKAALEIVGASIKQRDIEGIVFAYDEAQNMTDHAEKKQYPLSLMLEVFQSLQRKGIPFVLVFTGLPTLLPQLIDARTYSERMFHVLMLDRLDEADCRAAIIKPIEDSKCPVKFSDASIQSIIASSGGHPYFIQFICRELFDAYLQTDGKGISVSATVRKLDSDFFMGSWARVTDRQKSLLWVVANLEHRSLQFTVQEVVAKSRQILGKPFSASHVAQMFNALGEAGLVFRHRHGKYSFGVPLFGQFILRQAEENQPDGWAC